MAAFCGFWRAYTIDEAMDLPIDVYEVLDDYRRAVLRAAAKGA